MCRGQWWQSRTVSVAPVAGWTSSAGEGSTASAGPFSQWTQCDCLTSGPDKLWSPGIWMTHGAVHDGEGWKRKGVSPEVHEHLHSFEHVKLQVVVTAPDSQLLNLLSVSRPVTVLDEGRSVWCHLQNSGAWQRGLWMCSRSCRERRAVGRKHSPEELQCWSYGFWMRIFLASLSVACLSGSWWSTDRWRWGWWDVFWRVSGMMVLKAELNSTNRILI